MKLKLIYIFVLILLLSSFARMNQKDPLFSLRLPQRAEVRSQVQSRSHEVPQALVKFAQELCAQIEIVRTHPEMRDQLLEALKGCILASQADLSARALCMIEREKIKRFNGTIEEMDPWVPAEVVNRSRFLVAFNLLK